MRAELVTDALAMAQPRARGRLHYAFGSWRQVIRRPNRFTKLDELGLAHSLGRIGQCWDNALAESLFASLKNERVHHMVYPTRKKAKEDIARYIELFDNRCGIHSALGYRALHEVRTAYLNSQLAA
jgi:putative transposase